MSKAGALLAARVIAELKELFALVDRARLGWDKAKRSNDDLYLDSVALNIHGFYSGLERLFEKIASTIDGSVPEGTNWHQELLTQMSIEIPGIRSAVISPELKEMLEEFRGFRHVVRNVYTYHFNPEKLTALIEKIDPTAEKIRIELTAFADFLKE